MPKQRTMGTELGTMSYTVLHKLGLVILGLVVIGMPLRPGSHAAGIRDSIDPQVRSQRRRKKVATPKKPRIDYTKFSHQTHIFNQKLACSSCHQVPSKNWKEVRKAETAFPDVTDFPEHSSCLSCHRPQFYARERPAPLICSNCHVNVTPRDTTRFLFQSLGDVSDPTKKTREFVSEFGVAFPHDKHLDVVGSNAPRPRRGLRGGFVTASLQETKKDGPPASCKVCHETYQPQGNSSEEYVTKPPKSIGDAYWLKKGTFKTIPNSHTVCFTCHSSDSGIAPEPKDCDVCHKLRSPEPDLKVDFDSNLAAEMGITEGTVLAMGSRRISAGAFRHEGGEHPDLNCLGCHNVTTINTVDPKTMKVPVRSCGGADGCHITPTTGDGGALNFEIDERKKNPKFVCTKCHITFGKEGVPEDHPAAISAPKAKATTPESSSFFRSKRVR